MYIINEIKQGIKCDSINRPHSIFGRMVCISIHPGKMILFPFVHWFNKRYKGRYKFERSIFAFDLFLMGVIVTLATLAIYFTFFGPSSFAKHIIFEAIVAPKEIVSGEQSTLVIRYKNETNEELKNSVLNLSFPNHFLLQEIKKDEIITSSQLIGLGTIPVNGSGEIHIKGVMFGDVGGKQIFKSTLSFIHGTKKDIFGEKFSEFTFSPERSTLVLTLSIPKTPVAFQPIKGVITYKNTGTIDFPSILIQPTWPNGFDLNRTNATEQNGIYELPKIKAGSSGEFVFEGILDDVDNPITFSFLPSFVFGNDVYTQEKLTQQVEVIPGQIELSQSSDTKTIKPGTQISIKVHYKHVGTTPISDVQLDVESANPFLNQSTTSTFKSLKPGDEGDITVTIPIRKTVSQNELKEFENINIETRAIATYQLNTKLARAKSQSEPITFALTTPITFESFARYTMPSGDQIGRGPLPPRVGEKTSYWIFWSIKNTTNQIKNSRIEGTLPSNVTFSGRQSSSEDIGIRVDPVTNKIVWDTNSLRPTISPTSKNFGIAFEVLLTPLDNQIGTNATLLYDIQFTGTDDYTGDFINSSQPLITTNLPNDQKATKKGVIIR